jgi:hypothetical protein
VIDRVAQRLVVVVGVVDLDLFLADVTGHGLLFGDGFGAEPDPFYRDGLGGHDGTFGGQHEFVFLSADLAAGQGVTAVGVGVRLAVYQNFLRGRPGPAPIVVR